MPDWTPQQLDAIGFAGGSVLVSAAAGAGKTAVLAERCVHVLSRADPRASVDELLVVTFTEAAAAEMRERIASAVRAAARADSQDPHLARQATLVDRASICTIHSFCGGLLRGHFTEAQLDPGFVILDEDEAALLRLEALERLLEDVYESASAGADASELADFVEQYGAGRDESIMEIVLRLHRMLTSVVDRREWIERSRLWLTCEGGRLPAEMANLQRSQLTDRIVAAGQAVRSAADLIVATMPGMVYHHDRLLEVRGTLAQWYQETRDADAAGLEGIRGAIREYPFPDLRRAPRVATGSDQHEQKQRATDLYGAVREQFRRELQAPCRFTEAEFVEGLQKIRPHAELLLRLVSDFDRRYERAKTEENALDFDDLERKTLELLCRDARSASPSPTALRLQEQYRHVLVDEYQDINPVQDAILRLVSCEARPDLPNNLFCVGDVKQSIYRFRLADPAIFTQRGDAFGADDDGTDGVVSLQANFRSRKCVIDAVNLVFERLMTGTLDDVRYTDEARLSAGLEYPERPGASFGTPGAEVHLIDPLGGPEQPEEADQAGSTVAEWESLEREAYLIGRRIRELVGAGTLVADRGADGSLGLRPMQYRDVAILLRATKHNANMVAGVLQRMGVPVYAEMTSGYFDSIEVRDVLGLLQVLDNPRRDIPLASVLRGPFGDFTASEILLMRRHASDAPFHQAVRDYANSGADEAIRPRLAELLSRLDDWRVACRREPLATVLWRIYQESGLLARVAGLPLGGQREANLLKLHEQARRFGAFSRQGLLRFLRFVETLRQSGGDFGTAPTVGEADDVVRVMSIHRSKGLEFPVVVVAHLGKRFNFGDAQGPIVFDRDRFLGLQAADPRRYVRYPTLAHQLVSDHITAQTRAEELRILYVAMTRARERLILVGTTGLDGLAERRAGSGVSDSIIRGSNTVLDWLVAAMGAAGVVFQDGAKPQAAPEGAPVVVCQHGREEVRGWRDVGVPRREWRERLAPFAALAPVSCDAAAGSDVVASLSRSLLSPYPWEGTTHVPAVQSVSEWKRRMQEHQEPEEVGESRRGASPARRRPRFLTQDEGGPALSPTERGTATHTVLQHLAPSELANGRGVSAQMREMVARDLLTPAEADSVDVASVEWFFATDVGRRMLAAPDRVFREVAFVMGRPAHRFDPALDESDDPQDVILTRGIVDLVIESDDGLTLVDYKTDRVEEGGLTRLVAAYEHQLAIYADALGSIWQRPITDRMLAVLSVRELVGV